MKWCLQPSTLLTLFALSTACGGNVNLGAREQEGVPVLDTPAGASLDDPYQVKSERTLELGGVHGLGLLVVAGEFLYLPGYRGQGGNSGFFRCSKRQCQSTFQRLPGVNGALASMQADGERLVFKSVEPGDWIGSFALPDATDRQVLVEQLPRGDYNGLLSYAGFLYWPVLVDSAYYRCKLPTCVGGPRKSLDVQVATRLSGDGSSIFTTVDGQIARMTQLGDGPTEFLLPDATLSVVPRASEDQPLDSTGEFVTDVAASAGLLYGVIRLPCGQSCCDRCPRLIARWPEGGGSREELFRSAGDVSNLLVAGQELIWVASRPEDPERADLTTCRAEACSRTLRHLASVDAFFQGVAVDAERIYWLDQSAPGNAQVRSVTLQPTP